MNTTTATQESIYDQLAEVYDERYSTPECVEENKEALRAILQNNLGITSLLDLGCGTGLSLDLRAVSRGAEYTGVDLSGAMLQKLQEKHPWVIDLREQSAEEFVETNTRMFHTVISLFGAPSYMDSQIIPRLPALAEHRLVLMHYKEGYFPDYYDGSSEIRTPPSTAEASRKAAVALPGARVWTLNNMQVTVWDRRVS